MNGTETKFDKSSKEQLILEAAQKRFGIFGVEKTSMREIADDLKISKASLYYYYPDKESLYKAVVEKEQAEFVVRISQRITAIDEPGLLLREYANSRLSYFRTLLNLSRLRLEDYSGIKPVFKESIRIFREKEMEIIVSILDKGIKDRTFMINDTWQTASLFLDLLKGLRLSLVNDKATLIIDQAEYDTLLEKTIAFTDIFINGLKSSNQTVK